MYFGFKKLELRTTPPPPPPPPPKKNYFSTKVCNFAKCTCLTNPFSRILLLGKTHAEWKTALRFYRTQSIILTRDSKCVFQKLRNIVLRV